jgi:PBP4 family serine-type D-alanyl-D-alanine carboxypeptidase
LIVNQKSPLLIEILQVMMKKSKNLYADTILKTLGWQECGVGSFEEGRKVVKEVLAGFDMQPGTYTCRDGSGLSRYNLISPKQIVNVLKAMRYDDNWSAWKELFPISGVDGTLKYRLIGTLAEGKVIAKTGMMSNIRCVSGYLITEQNEEFVFSIMVNGHLRKTAEIDSLIDTIILSLVKNK